MPKDFQGANLRGHSFSDKALGSSNFQGADLRGATLTRAYLAAANFKDAKLGLSQLWFLTSAVSLLLVTALVGLIISYSSTLVMLQLEGSPFNSIVEISLYFVVAIAWIGLVVRQGLGSAFAITSIILAAMFITTIALTRDEDSVGKYISIVIVLKALGLAGMMAGVAAGSLILTIRAALSNRFILLLIICFAFLGSCWGFIEGIGSDPVGALAWLCAIALTLLVFLSSVYISHRAAKEDPKFSLIRSLAIFLATLKGTQFKGADLTDADFTQTNLRNTNFSDANLTRTRWFQVQGLRQSMHRGTYLEDARIQQLVVTLNGQEQNFDHMDLRGLNLQGANLVDASFIGAKLSEANLQGANLTRAKLVQTQLYGVNLTGACLTGAVIEDWSISVDTNFTDVKCDYVYMQLPTKNDPDPCRKPDNRNETFQEGDFANFIAPIIKTLNLYQTQNVDLRVVAQQFKTLDLFHHEGLDPTAAAIALKQLAQQYPEAELEVVALEGRGDENVRVQAKVAGAVDRSALSAEYFAKYKEISSLPYADVQSLLTGIAEKDDRIRSLESMVMTAMQQKTFYIETYQNLGDTVAEKGSINISAGGDIGNLSGIVSGETSGVVNVGEIRGEVVNTPNQQSQTFGDIAVSGTNNTLGLTQAGDDANLDQSKTQNIAPITGDTTDDVQAALTAIAQLKQLIHKSAALNPTEQAAMDVPIKVLAAELRQSKMDKKRIVQAMTSLKTGLQPVDTLTKPLARVATLVAKAYNSKL